MGHLGRDGALNAVREHQHTAAGPADDAGRPQLRVVRGTPAAEEVAALAAVFAALAQSARPRRGTGRTRPRASWDHPGHGLPSGLGYRAPGAWTS
ncbi:acyl-CoA carboxylase epsilon subunit [Streptomyces sp. 796.1]|uniref:acyl-CoA carboxylase epsilon subunit n=1 Tax=Streptomyces sp. 796.1 TaxID=3163029 RepID=UPI0039C9C825